MARYETGYVYFFREPLAGHIKVGWSEKYPDARLAIAQVYWPVALERLAWVFTIRRAEAEYHEFFARLGARGEWYRPAPELNQCIGAATPWRKLDKKHPDPTERLRREMVDRIDRLYWDEMARVRSARDAADGLLRSLRAGGAKANDIKQAEFEWERLGYRLDLLHKSYEAGVVLDEMDVPGCYRPKRGDAA